MIENLPTADVISTAAEYLRNGELDIIVGTIAGYFGGQLVEHRALKSIERHQRRIIEETGATDVKPSVNKRSIRRILTPLALTGALVGYNLAEAAQHSTVQVSSEPVAGLVSDLTLGTGPIGDNSATRIKPITEGIAQSKHIKANILVPTDNGPQSVSLQQYEGLGSNGGNTLPSTINQAIESTSSSAAPTNPDQFGQLSKRDGAIIVVTDDDPVWSRNDTPSDVVAKDNQYGKMPIYTINLGNNSDSTAKGLAQISQETGGRYYFVKKGTSATSAVDSVRMNVLPQAQPFMEHNNVDEWLIDAAGAAFLGSVIFRRRKRQAREDYISH